MGHQSDSTIITYKERGISMSKKKVVVSLGHDALGYTIMEQWDAVKDTAKACLLYTSPSPRDTR